MEPIMKKYLPRLAAILSLSLAAICVQAQTTYSGSELGARVSFQNNQPNGISVTSMQSTRSGSALAAQAQLQNGSSSNRHVYYRFIWLDGSGVQTGGSSSWRPVLLMGNQSQTVKDTAPSGNAADFRLELNVE